MSLVVALILVSKKKQYEELKDCTFQPQTNKSVKDTDGPIVVRGLGKHLERNEKAKKLKDDQKEREEHAFKVKPAKSVMQGYTIPEPFNLQQQHETVTENRKKEAAQKWKQEFAKECTFQPKTNVPKFDLYNIVVE